MGFVDGPGLASLGHEPITWTILAYSPSPFTLSSLLHYKTTLTDNILRPRTFFFDFLRLTANVPCSANQKRHRTQVWKPKQVGSKESLAPKPRLPRFTLKWSPSGCSFDLKGKLVASKETNCPNDDKACTSNPSEPMRKWFPNSNVFLGRVYFIEGLGHNLFSVGQLCDADLEVALRRNTCFIRDMDGVDFLKGNRSINLYTINLYDIASASPIFLMARATPTTSWLWHQRLSHLNFNTINDLAKNDLVSDLPKFKYTNEHLCPSCEQGKIKRASHPPKPVPNLKQRLHLLHMDLYGPMRVASINGKRYVLVIVDDYSQYTWVHFLRTKDETPEVIKNFLKKISVRFQAPVIIVRTDNGTEFKNQILKEYFDSVGIIHETSAAKTPHQNGVVERRNRTLVKAARTMLIFSHAPLFLWAKAIATTVYNRRTKKIIETMIVMFDELSAMAFEQNTSTPGLQSTTSRQISSELELTYAPSTITPQRQSEHDLDILFEPLHNEYHDSTSVPTNDSNTPVSSHNVDAISQQHAPQQRDLTPSPTVSAVENVPNAVFEGVRQRNLDRSCLDESMQEELYQFIRLDVWELVPSPDGIKPLTLKWLFKNKHDEENTVIRNKTRLVVRGYIQEEGIDFEDLRSSCSDGSYQDILGIRCTQRIHSVSNGRENCIFAWFIERRRKAPRAWYDELSTFLLQNRFSKGTIDLTLFTKCFDDDILVVNQSPSGIFINQSKYVHEILKKYGLNTYDIVGAPMDIQDKLDLDQIGTLVDATKYHSMIGALMYLTLSRPNIVHTTCVCARYQAHPTEKHLKEVKRVFRYLRGTVNMGLWYTKDSSFELTGFLDADYAGCKDTFKSTSGGA
nr:retrovirus-related Pol polyprotein from transposon TNT 1-94 [Tanacetum cinerariifolium]